MPTSTSELSNALNPYALQSRPRLSTNGYSQPVNHASYQPLVQPPQQPHAPHVSELQMAIAEPVIHPAPPPPPPVSLPLAPASGLTSGPSARSRQGAHVVAELFRRLASIQNAQEAEKKRRLAWEKEQEDKEVLRNSEIEKTISAMQDEFEKLRSMVESVQHNQSPGNSVPTPQNVIPPMIVHHSSPHPQPVSPISPVSQAEAYSGPEFVQGSSNTPVSDITASAFYPDPPSPLPISTAFPNPPRDSSAPPQDTPSQTTPQGVPDSIAQAITPDPSPQLPLIATPKPLPRSDTRRPVKRKKKRKYYDSDSASSSSSTSLSSSSSVRPRKRVSHHDTSCYTIHHAIRLHILRMMDQETDKNLPDSHIEGTQLDPDAPIRFVWDKTTRQSVHNARMKKKILDDIKENRWLYKDVPQNEFTKKVLETAFDQCFITFRQKFKSQRDALAASHYKQREEAKARRARHVSRRKIKLNNRSEARNKIEMFEHVIFDGALNTDCMSSEESDCELDPLFPQPNSYLTTHGFSWRSTRLLRFYCVLDNEDRVDSSTKPKRGTGRKERRVGPNKEEFILPPEGVSTWMISRRWYKASLSTHPDLKSTLSKLIVDPVGFDWSRFHELGEESGDDEVVPDVLPGQSMNT